MKNNTNPSNYYMDDSDPDTERYMVGLEARCYAGQCEWGCPICHDDHDYWNRAEEHARQCAEEMIAAWIAEGIEPEEDDPDDMLDRYWRGC